jgi:hypothetical protein
MRRAALASLAIFAPTLAVLFIQVTSALACSCAALTPHEYAAGADVVFTGTAVAVDSNQAGRQRLQAEFAVEVVYKGQLPRTVTIDATPEFVCGVGITAGGRYTVFAQIKGGTIQIRICGGTVSGAIDPMKYGFGFGLPPEATVAVPAQAGTWVALGVGLALVTLLVASRWIRRRNA